MEGTQGSCLRWRRAVSGGGERSQVGRSGLRWRGAVSGGGERSQVEGNGLRWREPSRCLKKSTPQPVLKKNFERNFDDYVAKIR